MVLALLATAGAAPLAAQHSRKPVHDTAEARASLRLEAARREGPPAVEAFLYAMPKGADLHNHLSGAVYAESWIGAAIEDGLCIDTATLSFKKPPASDAATGANCNAATPDSHLVPAAKALTDENLYDELIDAFSMRTFVPTAGDSGHDHFFNAFAHFGGTNPHHLGEWVDEVASRAAAQNEQYLELMHTPDYKPAIPLTTDIHDLQPTSDFAALRANLLSAGLRSYLPAMRASFDEAEKQRAQREHCGDETAAPACKVQVRYLYQVLRALPPELVFLQLVLGFEMASTDPRIVGINMVQPEDYRVPMADYELHMAMVGALHALYPRVHITLHAGELAPGLVPPAGLTFHVRDAVEKGHAERIGHGVDVMHETDPYALLKEMARRRTLVEISLTSNDVILNLKGDEHPFPIYRRFHVPVALCTDDEGVSRIELTHEYLRAVESYSLRYADLKQMVRASLEHSFLPGDSLWQQTGPEESFDHPRAECRAQLGQQSATGACAALLAKSERAQQQFELERRFHVFEASF